MQTSQRRSRKPKTPPTFEFKYQGKTYIIRSRYEGQHATIYTTDGQILHVQTWILGVPFEAKPERIETFDPQQTSAAELATATEGALVAELVQPSENGNAAAKV